ncbi:MAG: hypothetical protein MJ131_08750 [Lachnospiraceae bacterium]|nr:hypothetical protein [Lachnospiraceae bacterium]
MAILIAGMVFAGITTATLAYSKHEKLMHDLDINEKQVFNLYDMDREEFHSQYGDNVEVETVYDLPNKKAWMDLSEAEREEKLSKWIKELNERLERNHEK